MKIYINRVDHLLAYPALIAGEIAQRNIEVVVITPEQEKDMADFTAKRGAYGKMPILELNDGSWVFESMAIADYVARTGSHAGVLCGQNPLQEAQVQQWVNMSSDNLANSIQVYYNTMGYKWAPEAYAEAVKQLKDRVKLLNEALKGKTFLVANRLTMADICQFTTISTAFAFVVDAGMRKAFPYVSDWFARVAAQSAVMNVCGAVKMCEKAIKPVDVSKLPPLEEKKVEAPKKEENDDDFDPFADDEEEDEEAEKAKMARMKEIAKTAKSHGKVVIAKSIIIWEVKPWGEDTDLDELAKMILAIEMDGLFWKTEYKKEPIAYGVFKLVIGAVVEDEKVSTDIIQEKIEEFEDHV